MSSRRSIKQPFSFDPAVFAYLFQVLADTECVCVSCDGFSHKVDICGSAIRWIVMKFG